MSHRFTGTIAKGQIYDFAVIVSDRTGAELGGECVARHEDGTVTIDLGGVLHVRGRLLRFVPRDWAEP